MSMINNIPDPKQDAGGFFSRNKKNPLSNAADAAGEIATDAADAASGAAADAVGAAANTISNIPGINNLSNSSALDATSVSNKWVQGNPVIVNNATSWRQFDNKPFNFVQILQNEQFADTTGSFNVIEPKNFTENGFYLKLKNTNGDDYEAKIFKCIKPKKGMLGTSKCLDEKGDKFNIEKPSKIITYHVIPHWFVDNFEIWQATEPIDANVFQEVILKIIDDKKNPLKSSINNGVDLADEITKQGKDAFGSISSIAEQGQRAMLGAASGALGFLSSSVKNTARQPITTHMDNLKNTVKNTSAPKLMSDAKSMLKSSPIMKLGEIIPTVPDEIDDLTDKTIPEVSKLSFFKIYDSTTNLLIAQFLYTIDKFIDLTSLYTLGYKNISSINKDEIVKNLEKKRVLFLKLSNDPSARKIIQDLSLAVAEVLKTIVDASAVPVGKAVNKITDALGNGVDRVSLRIMNSLKNTLRIVPGIGDAYIIIENLLNISKMATDSGLALTKTANAASTGIADSIQEITPQIKGQLNFLKQTAKEFETLRAKISKDTVSSIKGAANFQPPTLPDLPSIPVINPANEIQKYKRAITNTGNSIANNIDNTREKLYPNQKVEPNQKVGGARKKNKPKKKLRKKSKSNRSLKYKKRFTNSRSLKIKRKKH